ncbi:hypothetical protein [Pararcticibacter amylolyticus]|uniref:hypothetical protein n=1 Tax=Pararcticibacter amylolyticus TaxID=2173175 RepID=UPI00192E316B|nr:hypothetical protein [Pararcticibacter amylolyticus]
MDKTTGVKETRSFCTPVDKSGAFVCNKGLSADAGFVDKRMLAILVHSEVLDHETDGKKPVIHFLSPYYAVAAVWAAAVILSALDMGRASAT